MLAGGGETKGQSRRIRACGARDQSAAIGITGARAARERAPAPNDHACGACFRRESQPWVVHEPMVGRRWESPQWRHRFGEVHMQSAGDNTTGIHLQAPDQAKTLGDQAVPNQASLDHSPIQVQDQPQTQALTQARTPGGESAALNAIKSMTLPDVVAAIALVIGFVLVLKHFGKRRSGRSADENLAHLEQARLLAQAARYQQASQILGSSEQSEREQHEERPTRRIDDASQRLERLIREADRRIRQLEELTSSAQRERPSHARGSTAAAGRLPSAPTTTDPEPTTHTLTRAASANAGAPTPPVPATRAESRLIEPRGSDPADDWQARTRQLSAAGLSAREIAFKLGKPIGHVELVLALQRGQIAG